eukprot:TRINITY_DN6313_c0_g1_i2.p1 TRINITY_DN6313_c0_g1~~TRINITY_DN6313_c0_g1_i2.p1  ORF type:complete len:849 (-),score=179.17 TRINITY_DN6313_c0_g1_i2:41-2587(-)
MAAILVPLKDSDQYVSIPVDDLTDDPSLIMDLLKAESAPLSVWLECAVQYYKKNYLDAFKKILSTFEDTTQAVSMKNTSEISALISIYNALASYYIKLWKQSNDKAKREEYYRLSASLHNKADKINRMEEITWVGKGIALLVREKFDNKSDDRHNANSAQQKFQTVLDQNPNNIPAMIGKACLFYKKGKYEESLEIFKKVLTLNPHCTPSVRVGMAYCYHKLGKNDLAKLALKRTLELDPEHEARVEAIVNLALLELNDKSSRASEILNQAIATDQNNSKVLNLIVHFKFKKRKSDGSDLKGILNLANSALRSTTILQVQAESSYHIARVHHAQNNYVEAKKFYEYSVQSRPNFTLALYGLGQVLLHDKQFKEAINCFEKVLKLVPDNYETLRTLGYLYSQKECFDYTKAVSYLQRSIALSPRDEYHSHLELAQLLETSDYKGALENYQKVVEILTNKKLPVPHEIYNNIAVLNHQLCKYYEAETFYRKGLDGDFPAYEIQPLDDNEGEEGTGEDTNKDPQFPRNTRWDILKILNDHPNVSAKLFHPINVSITFNLARLYEDDHQYQIASQLYKAILKEHSTYLEAYLRLGYMASSKGEVLTANELFKEIFSFDRENAHAWLASANLSLNTHQWQNAQKVFEKILSQNSKNSYACLQLGNIFLQSAKKQERRDSYLRTAEKFFVSVLEGDKQNIYAANGMAILIQEHGMLDEAKEILTMVRESASNVPDVWINLAHLSVMQGQFFPAIRLYKACLQQFSKNFDTNLTVQLHLYLAKALYESGTWDEAKLHLQKALHLTPWNMDLWYNLALTLQANATHIYKVEKRPITIERMKTRYWSSKEIIPSPCR